jgi:hypothetical protein
LVQWKEVALLLRSFYTNYEIVSLYVTRCRATKFGAIVSLSPVASSSFVDHRKSQVAAGPLVRLGL